MAKTVTFGEEALRSLEVTIWTITITYTNYCYNILSYIIYDIMTFRTLYTMSCGLHNPLKPLLQSTATANLRPSES